MNKTALYALIAASAIPAVPAAAQSIGEKTGVNSVLGVAPKTADFIKEAATSDMMEIAASKIALDKGNADEKTFAQQMIDDHTKTSEELKSLATEGGMQAQIPPALDDSANKKLDKLRDAKPADFAGDYDPMQVSAHEDAVSLFRRYAEGGDNPKLKDWAGKTLPHLQHHLDMAQALDKNRK